MNIFLIVFIMIAVFSFTHLLYKWKKLDYPKALELRQGFVILNSVLFGLFVSVLFILGLFTNPAVFELQSYILLALSFLFFPTVIIKELVKQHSESNEPEFNIRRKEATL